MGSEFSVGGGGKWIWFYFTNLSFLNPLRKSGALNPCNLLSDHGPPKAPKTTKEPEAVPKSPRRPVWGWWVRNRKEDAWRLLYNVIRQGVWLIYLIFSFGAGYSKSVCWKTWFQIWTSSIFVWFLWFVEMFLLKMGLREESLLASIKVSISTMILSVSHAWLVIVPWNILFNGRMGTCDLIEKSYRILAHLRLVGFYMYTP